MTPSAPDAKRPHIVWLDVMRFVAILMVVICHCTDPLNASVEARSNPDIGFWGAAWGALVRACVPLFVMITGALLLPIKQEAGTFYKKRIPRVVIPFLVWSVLFNLAPWFIQWVGGTPALVTDFFPYASDPSASLGDALRDIAMIPLTFTAYTTPMWYIYMLVGLYLYMPIFSAWVATASAKSKRLFLGLWGISLLLPYVSYFVSPNLLGVCSWNAFGTFYTFAGFNGYLLLGHCLAKGNDWSTAKIAALALPMFVVGYLITFVGFRFMTADPTVTEAGFELFFTYCSVNVVMMTAALFLLVQKVRVRSPRIIALLGNLTQCGLGIYLAHYFFVGPAYLATVAMQIPAALRVPIAGVIVFVCTWALVWMLSKLPKSKYIIG